MGEGAIHYVLAGTARKEENTVEKLLNILTADSGDAMDAEALSIMYKTKYGTGPNGWELHSGIKTASFCPAA